VDREIQALDEGVIEMALQTLLAAQNRGPLTLTTASFTLPAEGWSAAKIIFSVSSNHLLNVNKRFSVMLQTYGNGQWNDDTSLTWEGGEFPDRTGVTPRPSMTIQAEGYAGAQVRAVIDLPVQVNTGVQIDVV